MTDDTIERMTRAAGDEAPFLEQVFSPEEIKAIFRVALAAIPLDPETQVVVTKLFVASVDSVAVEAFEAGRRAAAEDDQ